jgi:hypothetical protein
VSDPICAVCEKRPTPDGYACSGCGQRATDHLEVIIDLAPDARLVAAGLVRRGGGSGSNKPGSRPPLNDGATDALDGVQNLLTTLARGIAEDRGLDVPRNGRNDPIVTAARWLRGQVEWLRHAVDGPEAYAVRAFDEIAVCAGRLRGLVNGPSEQKFLGPCGAEHPADCSIDGPECPYVPPCEGDVYAFRGAQRGRCRTCGAEVATSDREAWLNGEVRSRAFRAAQIAEAYGVNENNIRTWSTRLRRDTGEPVLKSYYRTEAGLIAPWVELHIPDELRGDERKKREAEIKAEYKARGPRLHYLGDVLDLEAAAKLRRHERAQKRERRAAAREAAESENAA